MLFTSEKDNVKRHVVVIAIRHVAFSETFWNLRNPEIYLELINAK